MWKLAHHHSLLIIVGIAALSACSGVGSNGSSRPPEGPNDKAARHDLLGSPSPSLASDTVNEKGRVSLEGWRGKVVVLDFWATWCEPCRKSLPALDALRIKYAARGLEVVGVSEDDDDDVRAGTKKIKDFGQGCDAKFPLLWDKDKSIAAKFKPPNMPSTFIIDKKGIVRHVQLGYHNGDEEVIERQVKSLL